MTREAGYDRHHFCLEANVPGLRETEAGNRDQCPGSKRARPLTFHAQSGVTSKHDGLVSVRNTNLVQNARDVVADGFLRKPERRSNFRIVETSGYAFQNSTLALRQIRERQYALCPGALDGLIQECLDLCDDLRPRRLIGERHVVFAADWHEATVGNEAGEQTSLVDRHHRVVFRMQDQHRARDPARSIADIHVPADLQQSHGNGSRGRSRLLIAPRVQMLKRTARLKR